MDINFITELSCKFRKALEYVSNNRLYGRLTLFAGFPNGCCRYTSDLLASFLIDNGIPVEHIQLVEGETKKFGYTHCWLMIDKKIYVDITADQFNGKIYFKKYEPISTCIVTQIGTYIYECFDEGKIQFSKNVGIDTYIGDIPSKLGAVYAEIIKKLNGDS